jgi:hypothetical protein
MDELVLEFTLISGILMYEILLFLSMPSWNSEHFSLGISVKMVEESKHLVNI